MRILYIGETATHDRYVEGNVPSHWLYGAVEMEKDGHEVVWTQEKAGVMNDLTLIYKHKPDCIFIPNLNLHNHLLLLILSAFGLVRIPVYAFLHHEPQRKKGFVGLLYKTLLKSVAHLFFLSELTRKNTMIAGMCAKERSSVPGWGPDMDFYERISVSDNGWFVSTGKENRDFDTLIEAFKTTGAPLHIITASHHGRANYEDLVDKCKEISNIKVTVLDNSSSNYPMMVREMASAKALVCPLLADKLNYCVGLSTIADAEGLKKSLIITDNPYHDGRVRGHDEMFLVQDVNDWVEAIKCVQTQSLHGVSVLQSSMENAFANMKPFMKL